MRKNALAVLTALCLLLVGLTASAQDRQTASPQGTVTTPDPADFVTRVFVTRVEEATGQVNGNAVHLNSDESLSVVWMSSALQCRGSQPADDGKFSVPTGASLSCETPTSGVMAGITAVTARVGAPLSSGSYAFGVSGCATCARNISVTTNDPFLTTTTGYDRGQVDEKVATRGERNMFDLMAFGTVGPDVDDATSSAAVGGGLYFGIRPLKALEFGASYRYATQNVWITPELAPLADDTDHPEHQHFVLAHARFSYPVIADGDREYLRLYVGGALGLGVYQYETYLWKQYPETMQIRNQNNETASTFEVAPEAGLNVYVHRNILLGAFVTAPVNVNGHDRFREDVGGVPSRSEPESGDDHYWKLTFGFAAGGSF